jgi:uncharacterized protein YkwD
MLANIRTQILALSLFVAAAGFSPAIAQTQYSIGNPSPEQQYMLELINRARANADAEAVRLGIGSRQEGPPMINGQVWQIPNMTQPLSWNPLLYNAAQNHASTLNNGDQFFSGQSPHTYPNGTSNPNARIAAAGYSMAMYTGPTNNGGFPGPENVAENVSFGSGPFTGAKLVATLLGQHNDLFTDQTVPGRGHRSTTTLEFFREIGIGVTAGTDNGQGNTWDSLYTVQNFGTQTNSTPFITGVVYRTRMATAFTIRAKVSAVSGSMFLGVTSSRSPVLRAVIPCRCRRTGITRRRSAAEHLGISKGRSRYRVG